MVGNAVHTCALEANRMARTGRQRKSQSEHRLQGTYRADRHAPEPAAAADGPAPAPPACPPDLGPKARAVWEEVVPELARLGILRWPADRSTLAAFCSMI